MGVIKYITKQQRCNKEQKTDVLVYSSHVFARLCMSEQRQPEASTLL